jgi:hypothetical protein
VRAGHEGGYLRHREHEHEVEEELERRDAMPLVRPADEAGGEERIPHGARSVRAAAPADAARRDPRIAAWTSS